MNIDKLVEVANDIDNIVDHAGERWAEVPEAALRFRPSDEDWSAKEIIGHLIDSASNNHQRFIRLQLTERLTFPDYGQDNSHWVRIQKYQSRSWTDLLDLWRHFNHHLAHVVRSVDPDSLSHVWQVEANIRVTLFDLMTDYVQHLKNHIVQITDTLAAFNPRHGKQ